MAFFCPKNGVHLKVQLAANVRTFRHFEVLAHEMAAAGAGLLNGEPRALRVSITMAGTTECERVVHIPEDREPQAEKARAAIHHALFREGILSDRELAVTVLARLTRELLAEESDSMDKK